ncbi:alpha/beta hydrolase [Paenibacillus chondroitinus]|uniref:Alpha/beta hydrolase n=1 Tax=Paenibacillus chondroitinus TaxID=59842 RepID=A0ABU6DD60_9BACL|nr:MULTISPECIES: alpha/beta hydrolase [Paenibacillus]MCY9662191.1 alpha/beta hydrolase [Paenibacillus anseongense]MEB4795704.1 alpha/beta hydrolase [Paenibacillus chondroitinus]
MGKESIQSRFIKAGLRFIQVNAIWKKTGEVVQPLESAAGNKHIFYLHGGGHVLKITSLHDIAKWYAGEESVKHYLVSPIYGNFHDLGRISVYIGTHDILYPDANKFSKLAGMQGIPINYYEYPSILHVWPLFPCPEARQAREQMMHTIRSSS